MAKSNEMCKFCKKVKDHSDDFIGHDDAVICGSCLKLVTKALAHHDKIGTEEQVI